MIGGVSFPGGLGLIDEGCSGSGSSSDSSRVSTQIILMVGTELESLLVPEEDADFGSDRDEFLFNAA